MDCSPIRLLRPWNFPGKYTGVGCHFLLQGIFPTYLSHLGSPPKFYKTHKRPPAQPKKKGISAQLSGYSQQTFPKSADEEFICLSFCSFYSPVALPHEWVKEVAQLCLTLCNPMDCSLPGFSVHGTSQARILEWVAISFSRRSSRPRDWTRVCHIVGRHFTVWPLISS